MLPGKGIGDAKCQRLVVMLPWDGGGSTKDWWWCCHVRVVVLPGKGCGVEHWSSVRWSPVLRVLVAVLQVKHGGATNEGR